MKKHFLKLSLTALLVAGSANASMEETGNTFKRTMANAAAAAQARFEAAKQFAIAKTADFSAWTAEQTKLGSFVYNVFKQDPKQFMLNLATDTKVYAQTNKLNVAGGLGLAAVAHNLFTNYAPVLKYNERDGNITRGAKRTTSLVLSALVGAAVMYNQFPAKVKALILK